MKDESIIVECFEEKWIYDHRCLFFGAVRDELSSVSADDTMLKFIDVDEKFKKTEIRYDFRTRKIIMG